MYCLKIAKLVVGMLSLMFVSAALLSPATSLAVTRPTDGEVFSGRFIPAFIGGAYDPVDAYTELAGMPVYVFAFDFWDTPSGASSWIISDLAVRTQIRADGSFQVQGLPTAAHYGVYFPFVDGGSKVSRIDCVPGPDQYSADATNPCKAEQANEVWNFRMPEEADRVIDVFSYKANYLSTPVTVDSQVQNGSEQVNLKHAFITNRKELDIDNNINTFPLVPNTTLRVEIRSFQPSGTEFEIWAQRVSRLEIGTGFQAVQNLEFPTIRGRATLTRTDGVFGYYTFQAYAPDGHYAVIGWRKEENSPDYKTWDSTQPLLTHSSFWAQIEVGKASSDWREALAYIDAANTVTPFTNRIIVWGKVLNENQGLMTSLTSASGGGGGAIAFPDSYIKMVSDTGKAYSSTDVIDPTRRMHTESTADVYDGSISTSIPAPRGLYAIALDPTAGNFVPTSDSLTLYLDTEQAGLSTYNKAAVTTALLHSLQGPVRYDINAQKAEISGDTTGYDSGIFIKAQEPFVFGGLPVPASGAIATIKIVNPDLSVDGSPYDVAAEGKAYTLNRLGEVHIPEADLKPSISDIDFKDLTYLLEIRSAGASRFVVLGNTSSYAAIKFNTAGLAKVDETLVPLSSAGGGNYNLAILNKIDRFTDSSKAYAQTPGYFTIPVSLLVPSGKSDLVGDVTATVYVENANHPISYNNARPLCINCYITKLDAPIGADNPVLTNIAGLERFYLHVPPPSSLGSQREFCYDDARWNWIDPFGIGKLIVCENRPDGSFPAVNYVLSTNAEIGGQYFSKEITFNVDDTIASPSSGTINYALDCEESGAAAAKGSSWLGELNFLTQMWGGVHRAACEAGVFFVNAIPQVFSVLYRYGLQTRALTQDEVVGVLFDVVRNITNLFYVFMFIIISAMTVLRYQSEQWHIRVLLPKLAIALILSNFSMLIMQGLLDLNNFATSTIFIFTENIIRNASYSPAGFFAQSVLPGAAITGTAVIGSIGASVASIATGLFAFIGGTGGVPGLIAVVIFAVITLGVIVYQLIVILVIYFVRIAIIWMLAIAAPAVFTLSVLPWFENLQEKWFEMVLKVSFIQTLFAGLLSIGTLLMVVGSGENSLFYGFGTMIISFGIFKMAIDVPKGLMGAAALIAALNPRVLGNKVKQIGENIQKNRLATEANLGSEYGQYSFGERVAGRAPVSEQEYMQRPSVRFRRQMGLMGAISLNDLAAQQGKDIKAARKKGIKSGKAEYIEDVYLEGLKKDYGFSVDSETPDDLFKLIKRGTHGKILRTTDATGARRDVTWDDLGIANPGDVAGLSGLTSASPVQVSFFTQRKGKPGSGDLGKEEILQRFKNILARVKANTGLDESQKADKLRFIEKLISEELNARREPPAPTTPPAGGTP